MKLKFPAIYSYAELGSRGAWTGNALLPTGLLLKLPLNINKTLVKHKVNTSCTQALSHVWKETARAKRGYRRLEDMWQGFPRPQQLEDNHFEQYRRASLASFCYNKKKAWNRGIRREPQRLDRIHRQ
ncbi:hypothetical protein ABE237_12640 [Brevibacillus formosus]|uniref:hypothetical protein n=1 Tax=Brevibacillus formosus TaxID=54913 RepID=UPI0018CC95D4|nr:hypothetical protein [Brevibacillus formosus]